LKINVYTESKTYSGDIITLIMELKGLSFIHAIKALHKLLGLKYEILSKQKENKIDILEIFKKVSCPQYNNNNIDLKIYDEKILDKFINKPNIWWFREGIPQDIQEKFKLGYCPYSSRITIPQRYWSGGDNDFIGCKGRTTLKDYEILGIPKYNAIIPFPKTLNVYGLQENYHDIQKAGEVIVFESEKSVLKMATWKYNNAVAILGHDISIEQVNILISLDVDICIAFDEDITEEYVIETCNKFKIMRNVSYIINKYDLLKSKMSPVDNKKKVFDYLYKYKVKVK
jgi:DNA primase